MELVIASLVACVFFIVVGIVILVKKKDSKKKNKNEYNIWAGVSFGLAGLSILLVFLTHHQHRVISKSKGRSRTM